jgi:hypothetical protein
VDTKIPPGAPVDSGNGASPAGKSESESQAFRDAAVRLGEIRDYVAYYLSTRADAIRLAIRNEMFFVAFGVVGLLAVGAAVIVAVTLLFLGIADGLGAALHGRIWLGDLIVGVVMLVAVAIAGRIGFLKITALSRTRLVDKYESFKRDQRERFGRDIK